MSTDEDFLESIPVSAPPSTAIQARPKGARLAPGGKFAPWMTDVAATAMADGLPTDTVARLLGVSLRTFERWRAEGGAEDREGNPLCKDPLLVEFAARTSQARAEAVAAGFRILKGHGMKDWRAQHVVLQVMDPEGPWRLESRSRVEHVVNQGAPEEDLSGLTDEELDAKARYEAGLARVKALPAAK